MGHRYYTKEDIQLFCCIKKLKDEGMLLKDLKPLIPKLTKTRMKLKAAETEKEEIATGSALPASAVSTSMKPRSFQSHN